jgi:hypothetical protein
LYRYAQRVQNHNRVRENNDALISLQVETVGDNVLGSTPPNQPEDRGAIRAMEPGQFVALAIAFNLAPDHFGADPILCTTNTLLFYTAASGPY